MDRKHRLALTIGAAVTLAGALVGPARPPIRRRGAARLRDGRPRRQLRYLRLAAERPEPAAADDRLGLRRLPGVLRGRQAHRVLQQPLRRLRDLGDGQVRRQPARRHPAWRLRDVSRLQPRRQKIVFDGDQGSDPNDEIYVVNAETGGGLTALTSCARFGAGCFNDFPAYSPDGTKIAFIHADDVDADGNSINEQVWVMSADGSGKTQLTFDANDHDQLPDWSPDGTKIAYEDGPGGAGRIFSMRRGRQPPDAAHVRPGRRHRRGLVPRRAPDRHPAGLRRRLPAGDPDERRRQRPAPVAGRDAAPAGPGMAAPRRRRLRSRADGSFRQRDGRRVLSAAVVRFPLSRADRDDL